MFCYQCEQTAKGVACTVLGVCGKNEEVADLQDLLIYSLQGLAQVAVEGRQVGVSDREVNVFTCEACFSTLTNVDFDPDRFVPLIHRSVELRERLKDKVKAAGGKADYPEGPATFQPKGTLEELVEQGKAHGPKSYPDDHPDILSLKHTLLFGIKGVCAYADHAQILGKEDEQVYAFIHEGLAATAASGKTVDELLKLCLRCGEINLRTMELLDAAHTERYGDPVPTTVPLGHKKGKAILVSGHDLRDMEEILKQSEGKGIYVYTHGEMLPCHGYPGLKKYPHFYGHFGTAWQNQIREFPQFPGPIIMTTNCIQKPAESYADRIFTRGLVGWPGIKHIPDLDFAPVMEKALALPGFQEDVNDRRVMVGFARNTVLGVADKVIELVKNKKIRHFFLVGGCDGAKLARNYYTEFVEKVPPDCVILTLACGKFRFFDQQLGDIEGIPRLLDIGQCNDAYSAIRIAAGLAEAFGVSINELPLSLVLSWYEQKAVAILLTLLYLGLRNMRLGPSLPAFLTPNILEVLVRNFDLKPISSPDQDLKEILG
uniref:Hydroxylamine reductase n=1 Tax=Desulfobacca acetoxidans TaxID=60893 RepID=A0A7C5EP51_9BACT